MARRIGSNAILNSKGDSGSACLKPRSWRRHAAVRKPLALIDRRFPENKVVTVEIQTEGKPKRNRQASRYNGWILS